MQLLINTGGMSLHASQNRTFEIMAHSNSESIDEAATLNN